MTTTHEKRDILRELESRIGSTAGANEEAEYWRHVDALAAGGQPECTADELERLLRDLGRRPYEMKRDARQVREVGASRTRDPVAAAHAAWSAACHEQQVVVAQRVAAMRAEADRLEREAQQNSDRAWIAVERANEEGRRVIELARRLRERGWHDPVAAAAAEAEERRYAAVAEERSAQQAAQQQAERQSPPQQPPAASAKADTGASPIAQFWDEVSETRRLAEAEREVESQ